MNKYNYEAYHKIINSQPKINENHNILNYCILQADYFRISSYEFLHGGSVYALYDVKSRIQIARFNKSR